MGVLIGQATGFVAVIMGLRSDWFLGVFLMVPMAADWGIQYLGLRESTNTRRLLTGLIGGAGYVIILLSVIEMIARKWRSFLN